MTPGTRVLEGVDDHSKEIILEFIGKIVAKLPEKEGLRLFEDLKEIAEACYKCEWASRTGTRPN
jgi:hypothetical protein